MRRQNILVSPRNLVRHLCLAATVGCAAFVADSCAPPTQRSVESFGTFRVAFGPSLDGALAWRADQLAQLEPMFDVAGLDAIGPDFVHTSEGEADIIVEAATLDGPCELFTVSASGAMRLRVDATCTGGYLALRRATAHGVVHAYMWSRYHATLHVCDWPLNAPVPTGCHPTIRCAGDDCLMSRGLARIDDGPTFGEAYTGDLASPEPTQTDLDLLAHCNLTGSCVP